MFFVPGNMFDVSGDSDCFGGRGGPSLPKAVESGCCPLTGRSLCRRIRSPRTFPRGARQAFANSAIKSLINGRKGGENSKLPREGVAQHGEFWGRDPLSGSAHLAFRQRARFVHGDIAVRNFLVDGYNRIYIADFGKAHLLQKITLAAYFRRFEF